jgi:hypothetical protein
LADAAAVYDQADKLQAVADAKPADLTRTHGHRDFGTSSLRMVRVATIVDAAAVPRQYCVPSQALIDAAAGKPGEPMPAIPGVEFRDANDVNVRR